MAAGDSLGGHGLRRGRRRLLHLGVRACLALGALTAGVSALEAQETGAGEPRLWEELAPEELRALLESGELSEDELEAVARAFPGADERSLWIRFEASERLATRLGARAGRRAEEYRALREAHACLMALAEPGSTRVGRVSHALARLLGDFARPEEAAGLLRQSLERMESGHPFRAYVAFPLVDFLQLAGRLDEAWAVLEAQGAELREHGGPEEIRRALDGLRGVVLLRMGLPDRAAPFVRGAFDYEYARLVDPAQEPNPGGLLAAYRNLCELLAATERHERTLELVPEILTRAELFGRHPFARGQLLLHLAAAHLELGDEDPAHRARAEARIAEALRDPDVRAADRARAHVQRAYAALRDDRDADARRDARAARALLVQGAAGLSARDRALLAAVESRLGLADDAGLRDAVDELIEEWRRAPQRPGGSGFLRYASERLAVGELVRRTAEVRGAGAALELLMRVQRAASLARALEAPVPSLEEVGAQLVPERGGIAVFFPGGDRLGVFFVDRRGVTYRGTAVGDSFRGELTELARRAARGGARTDHLERALGAVVLAELPAWERVVVVGRDLLSDVPVDRLRTPSGEVLGKERIVSYLPSLPVGVALARRARGRPPAALDLVVAAAPVHGSAAVEHLGPDAQIELDADALGELAAGFPAERVVALSGAEATWPALARLARPTVLHLFTHGVRDSEAAVPAGLVLAPAGEHDGLVFSDDVRALDAAPLVILSVCAAGRGPGRSGDAGAGHLGGAFLRAGAQAVVLTDGELGRHVAHALARELHRQLRAGASPAEALGRARQAADPEGEAAAMHVLGLGHRPLFDAPPTAGVSASVLWAGALAGLVAAGWCLARVRRRGAA